MKSNEQFAQLRRERVVVTEIDGAQYAVNAAQVVEYLPRDRAVPVPGTKPHVVGFGCHRTTPYPVVDLLAREDQRGSVDGKWLLVEYSAGKRFLLVVDRVVGLADLSNTELHEPSGEAPWCVAEARAAGQTFVVVDCESVLLESRVAAK